MFDIGWSELAVIAVVALVVIGPKDLPKVLRTVGQWVAKARAVARDFQNSVDEMAREADLQDVKKHIDDLRNTNVSSLIEKHVDPKGELREAFEPPKELSHDPFAVDPAKPANTIHGPAPYEPPPPYDPPPAESVLPIAGADTPVAATEATAPIPAAPIPAAPVPDVPPPVSDTTAPAPKPPTTPA